MYTPALEQAVRTALSNAMNAAYISSDYNPVDNTALFLEHTVNNIIFNSNINDLWGPRWSLFLATVVDDIQPAVSRDVAVLAVTEVLRRMTGHLDIEPAETIARKTGVSINDTVTSTIFSGSKQQVNIAKQACRALDIPSPLEVSYLYDAIGDTACPSDAEQLYKLKPDKGKPITEDDIPGMMAEMAVKRAKLIAERAAKRSKLAAEQTNQVVIRHQQEILAILRTAPVTEQGNKRVGQIMDQLQRESAEATNESITALRELIQAEREVARAEKELEIVMLTKPPINCNP